MEARMEDGREDGMDTGMDAERKAGMEARREDGTNTGRKTGMPWTRRRTDVGRKDPSLRSLPSTDGRTHAVGTVAVIRRSNTGRTIRRPDPLRPGWRTRTWTGQPGRARRIGERAGQAGREGPEDKLAKTGRYAGLLARLSEDWREETLNRPGVSYVAYSSCTP